MFHTLFNLKLNKPHFWKCIVDCCNCPNQPMNGPSHIPWKSGMSLNIYNAGTEEEVSSDNTEGKFTCFSLAKLQIDLDFHGSGAD